MNNNNVQEKFMSVIVHVYLSMIFRVSESSFDRRCNPQTDIFSFQGRPSFRNRVMQGSGRQIAAS